MSPDSPKEDAVQLALSESRASTPRLGSDSNSVAGGDADKLLRIASLAEQFNNDQIRDDARSAAERIAEGRFYVACVGQVKRGKSTLLNALMGEPVLPTGVVPVTSVPTILRFGERPGARVRLKSGEWTEVASRDIDLYVSETLNPENKKGVVGLEVFVPSPLLAEGMCLVDTPGLGSVFEGNTAATHAFLPHVDAAIVVIGTDPPISGDELDLVEIVSSQIPDILFVLNKADRVTEPERTAATSFAREILEKRLQRPLLFIFEISALEQVQKGGAQRDWAQLLEALERLVDQPNRQPVRAAGARLLHRLSGQLLMVINEERDALTRPFQESEKRIGQLRETASQTDQSLNDLSYLLTGEQQRLSKRFADRRNAFVESVLGAARRELGLRLKSLPRGFGPHYRQSAMRMAQEVARQQLMPWLGDEKKHAEEAYKHIAKRFTDLANDFLSRVRALAGSELAYLPRELSAEQNFRSRSEFRFYDFVPVAMPSSPLRFMADFLLALMRAHSVIDADAHEFLDRLLETNSERVRNDLENQVTESRRQLERELRGTLRELGAVAERALSRARSAHATGAEAVESSLRRLAGLEAELAGLAATRLPDLAHR
jgi:GTP-binding protein EngB required for normal cell division